MDALQKQFFVDSILRGYHIPLIYLHFKKGMVIGDFRRGDRLCIIDGQQRIRALYEFSEGAFPLLDPKRHPGRFPKSLVDAPCAWAGRDIHQLDHETRARFCATKLSVVEIETNDENEVRDLFIRLQVGKPLTPQEQRDAWPGKFGAFVCQVGGKKDIAKYPGQDFFRKLLRANVRANTPKGRQLAAQMVMLFATYREDGRFCDINRKAFDAYYIKNKDGRRVLGPLEREIVYRRDGKQCRVCSKEVVWNEAEFHHVDPHAEGGPTTLSNAALVHRACHPRSGEEVMQFAEHHT